MPKINSMEFIWRNGKKQLFLQWFFNGIPYYI